jgi:DNA-binding MarR family transcriptional regulator
MESTMNTGQRQALYRIALILEEFRKVSPTMPVSTALTLVTIAMEEGQSITEVANRSGIPLATVSRHYSQLGPVNPTEPKAWELIEYPNDLMNRRKKTVRLTPSGQRTIRSLLDLINREAASA